MTLQKKFHLAAQREEFVSEQILVGVALFCVEQYFCETEGAVDITRLAAAAHAEVKPAADVERFEDLQFVVAHCVAGQGLLVGLTVVFAVKTKLVEDLADPAVALVDSAVEQF